MKISENNFFSNLKFKENSLEQESIAFLAQKDASNELNEVLKLFLHTNTNYNILNVNELDVFLNHIEVFHFCGLDDIAKFKFYNALLYCKFQKNEALSAFNIIRKIESNYKHLDNLCYITTLNFRANFNRQLGRLDEALKYFYHALEIINNQEQILPKYIIAIKNNIALAYTEQMEFDKALDIYYENLTIQKQLKDKAGISTIYMNIAYVFSHKKNFKKVITFSLKAQKLKIEIGDNRNAERININLAITFLDIGDLDSAKVYLNKSIDTEDALTKRQAGILDLRIFLAELKSGSLTKEKKGKLLEKIEVAIFYIDKIPHVKLVLDSHDIVIEAYEIYGDLKMVNEFLSKKFKLYSTYVEQQKINTYKQIRAMHEIQLQEKELEKKEKLNKQLTKINEELERFTYMATHDLKSPLRNISAFSKLLNEPNNTKEDLIEYSSLINNNAKKMNTLITSLLKYSKIGYEDIKMEMLSLESILETVSENIHNELSARSSNIKYIKLPKIFGNKMLLTQLFQNILSNALKYNDKEVVQIDILSYSEKGKLIIEIKDNGIGIPKNKIDNVFKAFSRAHSAGQYDGTGIGLATCKKIMELHSGDIAVMSTEKIGSSFYLKFNDKIMKTTD